MTERHAMHAGSGGQWEVTHYRAEIDRRLSKPPGDVEREPATIESLHTKLARAIVKWGDPLTEAGQLKEKMRLAGFVTVAEYEKHLAEIEELVAQEENDL